MAPDKMGTLIAIGIASMFAFQVFVNIGVATAILPNTGIPLPFLSQGLSSLISSMIAIGIILNIRLQPKKSKR
jgi:rod shape determining protein RodA